MFANEYQGGTHVEVLGTQGQNPLSAWKVSGPQKGVQKVYDKALKGYVFACGAGCKMALPRDDRSSLGLSQPNLLLQLEIGLGGPFSVEVGVTDSSGTRRRMILSSSFSELKSTPLHCQVPLSSVPRDSWLNLVLPLADLAAAVFRPGGGGGGGAGGGGLSGSGPMYRSLDSLHLAGTCRLRRICTLREAPPLPQEGHDGQAMAPAKPLDFPPGLDCHTLLLDPRSLAFVSHAPANGGGGGGGLGATGLLGAGTGGGGGGGGGAGGGLGVVGTSTGAARSRPAALTLTHTSAGPGGGVVPLGTVGTGRNSNSGTGAARAHPHGGHMGSGAAQGHHGGPVAAALASMGPAGAPGSSDEDDSGSGVVAAAGGLSGAPSGQLSGPLASLPEGSSLMGTLSGQSTPTGRHVPSAAPPSPWAISRGPSAVGQGGPGAGGHGHGDHPPPSRLGRSPGNSLLSPNGASATAAASGVSLLSLAPANGGRPPRGNAHGGASAGGAPSGVNVAEDPTGGDASPFGGRRAVSAQTAVRHGPGSTLPGGDASTAPSGAGVVLGGTGATGPGGAAAGAAGVAAGGSALPRSPPWPRSVMSKRAQSGPARISTEALAQGLGETQAPDNMPMSPSLVPRHGRRAYNASNFPPTIVENEALSMSGGGAVPSGNGGGGGSNAIPAMPPGLPRSPNRSPARQRPSQVGLGVTAREPQSPSLPMLRPVRTDASVGGAKGGAEPPSPSVLLPNCGSPFAPLTSVLTVRGGVDASIDFSQQHTSGTHPNLRVGDLAADGVVMPCSPSFISTLTRHNSQRTHRYGGGGGGAGAGGGGGGAFGGGAPGPSMDFSSDSDDGGGAQPSGASAGPGAGAAASGAAGGALEVPVAVPRIRTRPPQGASPSPAAAPSSGQRRNSSGPGTGSTNSGTATRRTADADTPTRRAPGAGSGPVSAAAMSGRTSPATPNRVAPAGRAAGASGPAGKAGAVAGAAGGSSTVTASSPARQRPTPPAGGRTGSGPGTPGRGRGGSNANATVPDRLPPLGAGRGAPTGRGAGRGAGAAAAAAAGGVGGGGQGGPSRARTTATNEVDVEESITLTAGMWGGFGVDEDDDMLGSRHFRSPGGHGGGSDEERVGEMATGPSFGHNLAALGGSGGADESGGGVSPDRYAAGSGWAGGGGGAAGTALPPMGASGPSPPGTAMGGARGGGGGGQSFFGGAAGGAVWPPRVQGLGGEELPASPTRYPAAAAGPLSPPIRRSGNRSGGSSEVPTPQHYQPTLTGHIAPLDNSPLQPHEVGGGGGGGGGREATFNGFAHFAPRRGSGDGGGLDSPRVSSPTAAPLPFDPLLDEEALLAGHHHAGGLLGAYGFGHLDPHDDPMAAAEPGGGGGGGATDWSKVGTGPTPPELLNTNRAFTPPVVPASKALGVALAPPPGRGGGAGGRGGGGGRGGRGAQVLKVAGGKEAAAAPPASRPVITPALGESMVDLVYDPVLNCYYDGNTGQYYELKT